jgi:hypothetical protein
VIVEQDFVPNYLVSARRLARSTTCGLTLNLPKHLGNFPSLAHILCKLPRKKALHMWRIKQFKSPLGLEREMTPAGYLQRLIPGDYADAQKIIEQHLRRHDLHGFSGDQASWWCRNKEDEYNLVLVIEAEGSPEA